MGIRVTLRSRWDEETAGANPEGAGGPSYAFDLGRIRVGRAAGSDIQLPHPAVSGLHASLAPNGASYTVTDEASTNGVYVNGARIAPNRPKMLRSGDRIELGGFILRVEFTPLVSSATTAMETSALARHLVRGVLAQGSTPVAPPCLTVENGPTAGTRFEIPDAPCSVRLGRGEECELRVDDEDASREHAELRRDAAGVVVRDLGAKNGLIVNGRPVDERRLTDRDQLHIGSTLLVFDDPASVALEQIQAVEDRVVDLAPESPDDWSPREEAQTAPSARKGDEAASPTGTADDSEESEPWHGPSSHPEEVAIAPRAAPRKSMRVSAPSAPTSDLVIYVLAGLVLGASAFGLYWLMNAS